MDQVWQLHVGAAKLESFVKSEQGENSDIKFSRIIELEDEEFMISRYSSEIDRMFVGQDSSQKRIVDSLMFRQLSIESDGIIGKTDSQNDATSNRDKFQEEVVKTNKRMLKEEGNAVSEFKVKHSNPIIRPLVVDELRQSKPSFDSPIHRKKTFKPIAESDFKVDSGSHEGTVPFWHSANSKANARGNNLDRSDNRLFQHKKSFQNELRNSANINHVRNPSKQLNLVSSTDKSLIYSRKQLSNPFQKKSNRCKNENRLLAKTLYPEQPSSYATFTTPKTHQKKFSFDISKLDNKNLRAFQKEVFGAEENKGEASAKSKKDTSSFFSGMANSFVKSNAAPPKKDPESGVHSRLKGAHSIDSDSTSKHRPKFL